MRQLLYWVLAAGALLLLAGCEKEDIAPMEPTDPTSADVRFLALGDSYTIGTGVTPEESWPRQLARALEDRSDDSLAVAVEIIARNGWRTDELQAAIATADPQPPYELVSLLIGVNDQFQGGDATDYRPRFTALLEEALRLAGNRPGRVFVVSIPDYSYTPFGRDDRRISQELADFDAAAREIATARNVAFYNITPISVDAGENPDLIAGDDLHPSGRQYARWVEEVLLAPVYDQLTGD